jgi:endonuclease III related protein
LPPDNKESSIRAYYETLFEAWGPQNWWPARTPFEVVIGAYLTQNTAWTNVAKALTNLRRSKRLSVRGMRNASIREIERLIRPAGYFRQKAGRLKLFVAFLDEHYGGSLARMFLRPTEELRKELLTLNGIGPETADSILLYAGNHPVFVVDAYTRRIFTRHEILPEHSSYEEIRELFQKALATIGQSVNNSVTKTANLRAGAGHVPSRMSRAKRSQSAQVYNEMHALIVQAGKNYCRKSQPRCDDCPLRRFLPPPK